MSETLVASCPWCGRDVAYVTLSASMPVTVERVEAYCLHRKCRREVTAHRVTPMKP